MCASHGLIFRKSPHRRQTDGHRAIIARTYNWDQVLAERSPRLVFLIKIEDYKAFYSARKGLRLGGLSSISQQNRPFPSFETGARGIWKGPRPNEPRVKRKGLRIYKLLYKNRIGNTRCPFETRNCIPLLSKMKKGCCLRIGTWARKGSVARFLQKITFFTQNDFSVPIGSDTVCALGSLCHAGDSRPPPEITSQLAATLLCSPDKKLKFLDCCLLTVFALASC